MVVGNSVGELVGERGPSNYDYNPAFPCLDYRCYFRHDYCRHDLQSELTLFRQNSSDFLGSDLRLISPVTLILLSRLGPQFEVCFLVSTYSLRTSWQLQKYLHQQHYYEH